MAECTSVKKDHCFWLSGHQDSTHLFETSEIKDLIRNPLDRTEVTCLKNFASSLKCFFRPSIDEIMHVEEILRKLKLGIFCRVFYIHIITHIHINIIFPSI